MNFQLYNIHNTILTAQKDKDRTVFEAFHKEMIIALQDTLSKNQHEDTYYTLNIPQCKFVKKFTPKQQLIEVLEEYRGMEMGKKLKKYKFKKSNAYFLIN